MYTKKPDCAIKGNACRSPFIIQQIVSALKNTKKKIIFVNENVQIIMNDTEQRNCYRALIFQRTKPICRSQETYKLCQLNIDTDFPYK
jgi:hypothetical protein